MLIGLSLRALANPRAGPGGGAPYTGRVKYAVPLLVSLAVAYVALRARTERLKRDAEAWASSTETL